MKYKKSVGSWAFDIFNHGFMLLCIVTMLYPLLNVVAISLSWPGAIERGISVIPRGFHIEAYKYVTSNPDIVRYYWNSIRYAAGGAVTTILFTSMVGYALSIHRFFLKKVVTWMFVLTMFLGGGLIPTYLLISSLHMRNTIWVMILPGCVGAYTVFVFRTFFQNIPESLKESAHIDGANDLRILFQIVLPLSKPLLATYTLFDIVGSWNDYFKPMIYLSKKSMQPLQMLLKEMLIKMAVEQGDTGSIVGNAFLSPDNIKNAMIVITMLPILFMYPFLQKHFAKGVMIGSIKG